MLVPAVPQVNFVDSAVVRDLWADTSRSKVRTDQFGNKTSKDVLVVTTWECYLEKEYVKVG